MMLIFTLKMLDEIVSNQDISTLKNLACIIGLAILNLVVIIILLLITLQVLVSFLIEYTSIKLYEKRNLLKYRPINKFCNLIKKKTKHLIDRSLIDF